MRDAQHCIWPSISMIRNHCQVTTLFTTVLVFLRFSLFLLHLFFAFNCSLMHFYCIFHSSRCTVLVCTIVYTTVLVKSQMWEMRDIQRCTWPSISMIRNHCQVTTLFTTPLVFLLLLPHLYYTFHSSLCTVFIFTIVFTTVVVLTAVLDVGDARRPALHLAVCLHDPQPIPGCYTL